jgi:hypothetical protein
MITIVHGGQTGVDRGAHEAAIDNGWQIAGYMPLNGCDELGRIPQAVARFLIPHDQPGLTARTEANVRTAAATLIVVRAVNDPRATPGTAKTLDLAAVRRLPKMVVDPTTDPKKIAHWIYNNLLARGTLPLPFEAPPDNPRGSIPPRLLVAGPRESKWQGAQSATVPLLCRIARALTEITPTAKSDLALERAGQ